LKSNKYVLKYSSATVRHFMFNYRKPGTEQVGLQALADISRSAYAVIATKPVHRLQIRPIVHN